MDRRKARLVALAVMLIVGLGLTLSASAEFGQVQSSTPPLPAAEAAAADPVVNAGSTPAAPAVVLQAGSGASLSFMTQNGEIVDSVSLKTWDMPYLVLHRNGVLTDPVERTLVVQVTGIEVPPAGVTVTLVLETQHGDPDVSGASPQQIPVWRESRYMANTKGATQTGVSTVWNLEFGDTVLFGAKAIDTPTDYFRWELEVTDAVHAAAQPLYTSSRDYAFLMENQWIVPLPDVAEASAGAAPEELIVYYADMVPFRHSPNDPTTWLRREEITQYIRSQLVPAMIDAFRVQTDVWGFPWYKEWTPYRSEGDRERLSVALSDGKTWFHGKAPGLGNASLSLNVSRGSREYDTLTDGLMSIFHHELFHNLQRSIFQHFGATEGSNAVDGVWDFFTEGTAVLASSVGQPDLQFSRTWGLRAFPANATGFVGKDGVSDGDLNKSYKRINPYHAAAYWRYLYEQCGGMDQGVEDPAHGLSVIRQVLIALSQEGIADAVSSPDPVQAMPEIMDKALAGSSCPFRSYEESLQAFARAIYALRLEGGRCVKLEVPTGCGFYDPKGVYPVPPASMIPYMGTMTTYAAEEQPHPAGIPNSFGIDLVEVTLDPSLDGRPLVIDFHGASGAESDFTVQVFYLRDRRDGSKPRLVATQSAPPAVRTAENPDGHSHLVIPQIDTAEYDRLGLVITRIDAKESVDPRGAYIVALYEPY